MSIPKLPETEFVELIGRSYFSFLKGASSPEEMVLQARRLGYRGLAICDLNGLYGVVQGYQAAKKPSEFVVDEFEGLQNDFRFHIGTEIQVREQSSFAVYPKNKQGYTHLCQLITLSKRRAAKSFIQLDFSELISYLQDIMVIALPPFQENQLVKLAELLDEDLYLAVYQDQTWESQVQFEQTLRLRDRDDYQIVATNRPFMHHPDRKPLHDVVTCIDQGLKLKQSGRARLSNSERALKSLEQLHQIWKNYPEAVSNTLKISDQLQFSLDQIAYNYPEVDLPAGESHSSYLRKLTFNGLKHRYPENLPEKVIQQAEKELALICDLQFENYFLTLNEICAFARERSILFQGRGSAANSVVCYALGLTAVDPSRIELLFERFLSKERGEPPDIDIDFQSDRREEVLQYIYQRYGERHSAMVATVICFRSRLAIREVAKVLGFSNEVISQLIHFMGRDGLKRLLQNQEPAETWGIDVKEFRLLLSLATQLIGFPRHLGIHSGGFLITREPIYMSAPVERASMQDRFVVQWSKEDLKTLKMMKIDILGLGMLAALNKAFSALKEYKGVHLELHQMPEGDSATYQLIQTADTVGVFQIESRAQMSLLPRLKPQNFYDLVVEVAIVRPGPLQGGMVHPYIRRRHGKEPVRYAHPDLEPILKKTLGVPIFQEQIMQMAVKVCGFTPGEADELRRIMTSAWTKKNQMDGLRHRLIQGMLAHGISQDYAEQIYQTIVGFGAYGFPESHAASFALLTYASCYLKQHHPEVFLVSLLNSQPMGFYPPRILIDDAKRRGVEVLPICVQKSSYDYVLEWNQNKLSVRQGFRSVRGLPQAIGEIISKAREQGGSYHDLCDFIRRTQITQKQCLLLASVNAFSCFDLTTQHAQWRIKAIDFEPKSFFYGQTLLKETSQDLEAMPKRDQWTQIRASYSKQGYSLTHHPVGLIKESLDINRWYRSDQLLKLPTKTSVSLIGLLAIHQRPPTAKGIVFLTLEDEAGLFNSILKPEIYEKYRLLLRYGAILKIDGSLQNQEGVAHVQVQSCERLA